MVIRRLMLLAVVLLVSRPALATTIEITSGSILSDPELRDTFYNFSGPGFSAVGTMLSTFYQSGSTFGVSFTNTGGTPPTQINIAGFAPCIPQDLLQTCGGVTLAFGPLPPVLDPQTYLETVSFTASGHADTAPIFLFGQPTECCDLVGHGLLTMRYANVSGFGFQPKPTFAFVVPEPSSMLLCAAGLLTMIPLLFGKKLRGKSIRLLP